MKKIVSAITALCMVVSMGATMASAATSTKDETTGKYTIKETFPTAVATGSVAGAAAYPDWTLSGSTARVSTTLGFGNDWNLSGAFAGFYTAKKISGNYTYELVNIKSTAYSVTGKTSYIYFNTSAPEQSSTMIGYRLELYMTSQFEWTVRLQKNNGSGWVYADTSDTEDKITIKHKSTSGRDGIKVNYAISQTVNSDGSLTINCQATYTDTTQPNIGVTDGTLTYTDTAPVAKSGYIGVGNSNARYESFGSIRVSNADLIDVFAEDLSKTTYSYSSDGWVRGCHKAESPGFSLGDSTITNAWTAGINDKWATYTGRMFADSYSIRWTDKTEYTQYDTYANVTYFNMDKVPTDFNCTGVKGYRLKKSYNNATQISTFTLQRNDGTAGWVDINDATTTLTMDGKGTQVTGLLLELTKSESGLGIKCTVTPKSGYTTTGAVVINCTDATPVSTMGYFGVATTSWRGITFSDISVDYKTKGIATPVSTISATEILADAPLTVTFANALGMTPTADNVSVKDAEENPVTVKVTSGKNSITITPQGMSKKTAYTVIVKDVADAYGNLMGGEWTVNTKASTSIYIDSVTGVSYNEDTKAVSYNATLKNYEATGTAYVIVVAYDSSNRLLGVEIYPNQTITSSEAVTLNTPFTVTKKPATVKCFAWNNFTDIIPYCDAVAVTVE